MKKYIAKKTIVIFMITAILFGIFQPAKPVYAAAKTISLAQSKKLALAGSDSYQNIKNKITLKEVSYKQAVKSIQLKIKNKTTFRWSPLLSFKFPEKLNFEDESSMVYKPAQIQTEIKQLKHDLQDEVYAVYENTEQAFLKCYTYQEKVAFEEEQLEELEKTLAKNQARLILGLATGSDVESIEKNLAAAEEKLAQDQKSFENAKEKLTDLIGLDVSTEYSFSNPYVTAEIPRTMLEDLILHTLDNDQSYYEAKMQTQLSLLQLTENYSLLKGQYGSDIGLIGSFVQQVKNGQKIDSSAFKLSYDEFLKKIDQPWNGNWRILFIKIPKEWLKGQIDGVRYIEDEPYTLYENALEYQDVLAEQETLKKELETQVKDSFESMVTARTSYLKLEEQCKESETKLKKEQLLNSMGELSFEEYTDSQNQYESQQIEKLEALELYSSLLYSMDRLTCGGITEYLKTTGSALEGTEGGSSYLVGEEEEDGAKYYIQSVVEDNMFEFGIYIPSDFETDISHYELWVDDYVVGGKQESAKTFRHLTLSLTGDERVFVRLYDGDEFVDDCEIDPSAYQGPLEVETYVVKKAEDARQRVIGSYEIRKNDTTGMMEITLNVDGVEDIHYYAIQNEDGNYLVSEEKKTSVADRFIYMSFAATDLESLKILCFDKEEGEKYTAYFDAATYEIYVLEEE